MVLKEYFRGYIVKMLENFSSAKVLMFMLPFLVSTGLMIYFMYNTIDIIKSTLSIEQHKIIVEYLRICGDVFIAWCTFNVSLAGTIVVVREIFKVKKLQKIEDIDEVKNFDTLKGK